MSSQQPSRVDVEEPGGVAAEVGNDVDDNPEHVPVNAWVTMGIFAVFVIAFGTCASTFMFQ